MRTNGESLTSAYHVAVPREGDAIGLALRDAYTRDQELPEDMTMLLRALYAVPTDALRDG
ncbi:MAG: hypothetical protein ACOY45_15915 [Pseudomonadota bacterium]